MASRIALFTASLAAALVLAAGMALIGMAPGGVADAAPVADPVAATAPAPAATPDPVTQVDTVYLTPQATPKVIVTKVVKTKPAAPSGENENESESETD
jgi:hypothetical protein